MIIFVEGPRNSGKTTLLDYFFEKNKNPNIIYYKFYFAKYLDQFGIKKYDDGPGVHYFSISNILTILELNKTLLKDKMLVFDRSIFSAYVWSILRNRMDKSELLAEFEKILDSELYQNCKLLFLTRHNSVIPKKRTKDYFDNFENYNGELNQFNEIIDLFFSKVSDLSKNNSYFEFENFFTDQSKIDFFNLLNKFLKND